MQKLTRHYSNLNPFKMFKALLRKLISTVWSKRHLSWDYTLIVSLKVTDFYPNRSSPSSDMLQKTNKDTEGCEVNLISQEFLSRKYVTKYSMLLGLSTLRPVTCNEERRVLQSARGVATNCALEPQESYHGTSKKT